MSLYRTRSGHHAQQMNALGFTLGQSVDRPPLRAAQHGSLQMHRQLLSTRTAAAALCAPVILMPLAASASPDFPAAPPFRYLSLATPVDAYEAAPEIRADGTLLVRPATREERAAAPQAALPPPGITRLLIHGKHVGDFDLLALGDNNIALTAEAAQASGLTPTGQPDVEGRYSLDRLTPVMNAVIDGPIAYLVAQNPYDVPNVPDARGQVFARPQWQAAEPATVIARGRAMGEDWRGDDLIRIDPQASSSVHAVPHHSPSPAWQATHATQADHHGDTVARALAAPLPQPAPREIGLTREDERRITSAYSVPTPVRRLQPGTRFETAVEVDGALRGYLISVIGAQGQPVYATQDLARMRVALPAAADRWVVATDLANLYDSEFMPDPSRNTATVRLTTRGEF